MRILIATHLAVTNNVRLRYGVPFRLQSALQALGHDVTLYGFDLQDRGYVGYALDALRLFARAATFKPDVYIGVDPVNGAVGVALRACRRTRYVVFVSIDFARRRFCNRVLNALYHFFDRLSVRAADAVWNVSSRMVRLRAREYALDDRKNAFIPNAPLVEPRAHARNGRPTNLVCVAQAATVIDWTTTLDAIARIRQRYPDVRLTFIGDAPNRPELDAQIFKRGLEGAVQFAGVLPHEEALEEIAKADIGLAIYGDNLPWIEFGDSQKAREYLAFGLPVVITAEPSTADDIAQAGAGVVVARDAASMSKALSALIGDPAFYARKAEAAHRLAMRQNLTDSVAQAMQRLTASGG